MTNDTDKFDPEKLRDRAVEKLKGMAPVSHLKLFEFETLKFKVINEIKECRIELERNLDELKRAKRYNRELNKKYNELLELYLHTIFSVNKSQLQNVS